MKNNEEILKKSVQALNSSEIPEVPEGLISSTVEKMSELKAGSDNVEVKHFALAERIGKMKRYGKYAIAAGFVMAVLLGVNFFPGQNGGVVWADALSQIQQVKNMMYRISMTMDGSFLEDMPEAAREQAQNMESTVLMSDEYGMKMEVRMGDEIGQLMYMLPAEKAMISVMPGAKKYMRIDLDDEMMDKMQKESRDPRYMASRFMESEYEELGSAVIDGIQVEGIVITDPAVFGGMYEKIHLEYWVDIVTGLPVQMKMDVTMAMGEKTMNMQMVTHDFQMNIEIDPAEFVPDIGDDYTELPSMQMPKMDGSSAIESLKKFHEMAGVYPKNLNIMNLIGELQEVGEEQMKEQRKVLENMAEEGRQAAIETIEQETIKDMMPIMSVGQFYIRLVQEKRDPMYYGENVTPDDSDAILLRWRLDDGKYRVIFGDLDQKDVSAEQLAEWENTTE
jgi:hypothetical protein